MHENQCEVLTSPAVVIRASSFPLDATRARIYGDLAGGQHLTASLRSIEGISFGTDVRLARMKIGTVTDLALGSRTYRATNVMTVSATVPIPDNSIAELASEGLLDKTFIDIVPVGTFNPLAQGGENVDTQGAVGFQILLQYVSGESEDLAA